LSSKITYVVCYNDKNLLKKWHTVSSLKKSKVIEVEYQNAKTIPSKLNEILSTALDDEWVVFCPQETFWWDLDRFLKNKSKDRVYGLTGATLNQKKKNDIFYGNGQNKVVDNKVVDSLGNESLIIHSKLIKKHKLKFDEKLNGWHFTDFSIQCRQQGISCAIIAAPAKIVHRPTELSKYQNHMSRLRKKFEKILPIGTVEGSLPLDEIADLKSNCSINFDKLTLITYEKRMLENRLYTLEKKLEDTVKSSTDNSEKIENFILDELEKKLIFIFGTPRSGSTWLAQEILNGHRIKEVDEPMIGAMLGAFIDDPNYHFHLSEGNYEINDFRRIVDEYRPDDFDLILEKNFEKTWVKSLRELILKRIIAQRGIKGYDYVVIKSPNESHGADIVMKCFPNSRLIFLIRDGRDVIDSRQSKKQNPREGMGPETESERLFRISHFAIMWRLQTTIAKKAYDNHNPNLRLFLKYEDLRTKPFEKIKKIYQFLGISLTENEIKHISQITKFESIPQEQKGIDKNKRLAIVGSFKKYFTEKELQIINQIMKKNLKKFGYKV